LIKAKGTGITAIQTDVLTPQQRRYCMSQIRGRDTKPELLLRRVLWGMGLRYRLQSKITGRPDLLFVSARVAIFVDGCQWHCCPRHWVRPKSNVIFWDRKFNNTKKRDVLVNAQLKSAGWKVLRFWEHEVEKDCRAVANRILRIVER
jgi:DNA mismatch endonuclease (patch repair protein)